jgi:hypothetical protein
MGCRGEKQEVVSNSGNLSSRPEVLGRRSETMSFVEYNE